MKARTGLKYAGFGVLGIGAAILFTFVVMWLWNWLVPEIFNGPELGYWQTLGLLVLSKIIFSGIGGGGSSKSSHSRKHRCDPEDMPEKYREKWRKKFETKMNGKVEEEKRKQDDEGEVIIPETE